MSAAFQYTSFPQQILFGSGALAKLGEVTAGQGWTRLVLVTTHSQRANGTVARIQEQLSEPLRAVFDAAQPHVPQADVDAVTQLAREREADALIALGGGSAIGAAKAACYTLLAERAQALPILAIPTTYAGSEMTPVFGVT